MMDYWWVTRPKRKLNSIPEVLALVVEGAYNRQWEGQRDTHLSLEETLEKNGLKRVGERRDRTGGGARTYLAWVSSLGLVFTQASSKRLFLTLAGEAIMAGDSPVAILKNQILKYQFPSPFSISRNIGVSARFKIRPFRFLLRLMADERIAYITEEEIAGIICVEAENESRECYERIAERILDFRSRGDACLPDGYPEKFGTTRQNLKDIANTLANWLEYTQLVERTPGTGRIKILEEKRGEAEAILATTPSFIDRPDNHEYFQRKYGIDPKHAKDTRNLTASVSVTARVIAEQQIRRAYLAEALRRPVAGITSALVDAIADATGLGERPVEETL